MSAGSKRGHQRISQHLHKRPHNRHNCGKETFPSEAAAERRAAREAAKGRRLWPYRCNRCKWWHLTSKPQNKKGVTGDG